METSDQGVKAWKEHATAFDRVRSIASGLDRPKNAGYIGAQAAVSETTAHDHLKRLAEMNIVRTVESEAGTLYEPDPLYARFRTLRRLIDEHDHTELLELKAELQQDIETIQTTYEVESPRALRSQTAETETAAETMERVEAASDWDLMQYHLSLVDDAIANYTEYADRDNRLQA